jgi:hypothetical protein
VEAAPGPLADLLSGTARSDRYALDPRTGRALVSSPGEPDGRLLLSAKRLARVARLARALDAWRGTGVEAAFSFDGERLLVAHARALLPPAPLTPRTDPLGPRPEPAQALDVRPVR